MASPQTFQRRRHLLKKTELEAPLDRGETV